jgi:hypothetical protein
MSVSAKKRRVTGTVAVETADWVESEAIRRRVSASWVVGEAVQQFRNRCEAARGRSQAEQGPPERPEVDFFHD